MFPIFDVSTSGLVAQRTRLNAISSNIANISTTRNEAGVAAAVVGATPGAVEMRNVPSARRSVGLVTRFM